VPGAVPVFYARQRGAAIAYRLDKSTRADAWRPPEMLHSCADGWLAAPSSRRKCFAQVSEAVIPIRVLDDRRLNCGALTW